MVKAYKVKSNRGSIALFYPYTEGQFAYAFEIGVLGTGKSHISFCRENDVFLAAKEAGVGLLGETEVPPIKSRGWAVAYYPNPDDPDDVYYVGPGLTEGDAKEKAKELCGTAWEVTSRWF